MKSVPDISFLITYMCSFWLLVYVTHITRQLWSMCYCACENHDTITYSTIHLMTTDIEPCDSSPCKYNGTCTKLGFTEDFTCECIPGYTGQLCELGKGYR